MQPTLTKTMGHSFNPKKYEIARAYREHTETLANPTPHGSPFSQPPTERLIVPDGPKNVQKKLLVEELLARNIG
jgi:hypothetical protein